MKINPKKLKRNADIGDKLDLVPAVGMFISLFGIGIFYWFFVAAILPRIISFCLLSLFAVIFVISFILYGIGLLNRRIAEKTVFRYLNEKIGGVTDVICQSNDIHFTVNISLTKQAIVFTLASGATECACDLTPAKNLTVSSTLFIDVCLGLIGSKVKGDMENGKVYKNVSYNIVINGDDTVGQHFVKDCQPNVPEMDRVVRIYGSRIRKYNKNKG
ncbi:MAG: hypothetical protein LUI60_07670 [Clostridia bacterium]|nr:hypothetical protein [Clostridia bacterium]